MKRTPADKGSPQAVLKKQKTEPGPLEVAFNNAWKSWIDKGVVTQDEAQNVFDILICLRPSFQGSTLLPPLLSMSERQLDSIIATMTQMATKSKATIFRSLQQKS